MKSTKMTIRPNRFLPGLLLAFVLPLYGYGKKKPQSPVVIDSIRLAYSLENRRRLQVAEVDFVIARIDMTYISGRRGLSDEEWNRGVEFVRNQAAQANDAKEYYFAWRYLGLLTRDSHFPFPDGGMFDRESVFSENDTIFPLWVQTWTDGTVYNVKDYSGVVPCHARILSVNGRDAKRMALINRAISPGEEANAMAMMNVEYEADPCCWANFANFLFAEGVNPPYEVIYTVRDSSRPDTVILQGMTRGTKAGLYKKSGDKSRVMKSQGKRMKPVRYEKIDDSTGVLTISSFWGGKLIPLFVFTKDWRYKRLFRHSMRRIDRDGIKNLIIDLADNAGGMVENIYYTLNYFTDIPVDRNEIFHITDHNRESAQTIISTDRIIPKDVRERLMNYIGNLEHGTVFCTDTVCNLQFVPNHPKHSFHGSVYLLTSNQTYSTAQVFTQYYQKLGLGPVAGQHCGGYCEVTGNSARVPLPLFDGVEFRVPYFCDKAFRGEKCYDYPPVDIPIDHPFGEWLKRENHSLDRLIEMIRSGKYSGKK